jgi:hypothetical protein
MNIVDKLQQIVIERSKDYDDDDFVIHGQWGVELMFKPDPNERTFHYWIYVTQTKQQGTCYCMSEKLELEMDLMGEDARTAQPKSRCLKLALLDAAYSVFFDPSVKDFYIEGTSAAKAIERADIVADEIIYQLPEKGKNGGKPAVLDVGFVGNIVRRIKDRDVCDVYANDLDENLVNRSIHGVKVQHGLDYTLELVEKCDVALITGMTVATGTLGSILDVAKEADTKVVMFAETGAWFAQTYCDRFGVDAVISEPFPFYIFAGQSLIRIHRPSK